MREARYVRIPFILINWDCESSEYAEHPDNWIFCLKIGYIGSLKWEKNIQTALSSYIFIYVQIKH